MTSITYYPGYSQIVVQSNLITQTITAVTQSDPMVVTTLNNHNYVIGMMVTFLIPPLFGMPQLNNLVGQVINLTNNTLTVSIDSTNFFAFSYPGSLPSAYTPPSVIPYSSGAYLPPQPLPYGNENSFEGAIYNAGAPGDLI